MTERKTRCPSCISSWSIGHFRARNSVAIERRMDLVPPPGPSGILRSIRMESHADRIDVTGSRWLRTNCPFVASIQVSSLSGHRTVARCFLVCCLPRGLRSIIPADRFHCSRAGAVEKSNAASGRASVATENARKRCNASPRFPWSMAHWNMFAIWATDARQRGDWFTEVTGFGRNAAPYKVSLRAWA